MKLCYPIWVFKKRLQYAIFFSFHLLMSCLPQCGLARVNLLLSTLTILGERTASVKLSCVCIVSVAESLFVCIISVTENPCIVSVTDYLCLVSY